MSRCQNIGHTTESVHRKFLEKTTAKTRGYLGSMFVGQAEGNSARAGEFLKAHIYVLHLYLRGTQSVSQHEWGRGYSAPPGEKGKSSWAPSPPANGTESNGACA